MNPLVSIIIPIYNAEEFIKNAVQSLLQQTYTGIEIIIVDDSSTDNSYAIAKELEGDKIRIYQQRPNNGAASARNLGLAHARGELIQFMDVDDYLSPDKIESQVLALNGREKLAVCNYISFNQDQELARLEPTDQSGFIYSTDDPIDFLINLWGGNGQSNFIQTNCWLVPLSLIKKSGEWRDYRCPDDDGEFFARVLLASGGIVYVPGVYNYYRRTQTTHKLSSNTERKYVQNTLLTIDLKHQYLKAKTSDARVEKAMAKQYLDFAVHQYPQHAILSKIAFKRYRALNQKVELPVLGGRMIELVKQVFGWRFVRLLKFYTRRFS